MAAANDEVKKISDTGNKGLQKILDNQRLLNYEPLVKAQMGEEVTKQPLLSALVLAMDSALPYLSKWTLGSLKTGVELARNAIANELKYPSIPF